MIEQEIKRLTEGLKMTDIEDRRLRDTGQPQSGPASDRTAPTKPTGGTVLEALENLQTHAARICADAWELENALTGTASDPGSAEPQEPFEAGIWGRIAAKIVMIERSFAQIDEMHNHAQASLK
jgi:hypothetical protein